MAEAIGIVGLDEFRNRLRAVETSLPRALRLVFNESAEIVAGDARPRVARKTGRAASTVKLKSTQRYARVAGGGNKAPYYPWLDFGGRVGRRKTVRRTFIKDGRYIYAAYFANTARFREVMERGLRGLAESSGIAVD